VVARLISENNATGPSKPEDQPLDAVCIEIGGIADTLEALVDLEEVGHDPLANSLWYLFRRLRKCIGMGLSINLSGNAAPEAYRVEKAVYAGKDKS
jgi:hypothetical protein